MTREFDPAHSRVIVRGEQVEPTAAGMEYRVAVGDLNEGFRLAMLGAPEWGLSFEEFWKATIRDIREAEEMDPPNWKEKAGPAAEKPKDEPLPEL